MAVDLSSETLLSLSQAARRLPPCRADRPVNPATIWRWIAKGARRPDGTRITLEAVRLGGRWLTSAEALARFAAALTPESEASLCAIRSPCQRHRDSERASAELERLGI
jgi:hypothetical protein